MKKADKELINAVRENDVEGVKKAIKKGADPNVSVGEYGIPPLVYAAYSSMAEVGKVLLENGADANIVTGEEELSALWLACGMEDESLAIKLIESGGDVNHRPVGYEPTLHKAISNAKLVMKLLDAGADVNCVDPRGVTPLMLAVFFGEEETVKILLDRGADLSLRDETQKTALDVCRERLEEKTGKTLSERLDEGDVVEAFFAGLSFFGGDREKWERIEKILLAHSPT